MSSKDIGQGAIEVFCYQDRDLDGEIDPESDPRLFSDLTNAQGDYELKTYFSEVQSVKSDITASNEDAGQDGFGGTMSLAKTKHKSVISFLPPTLVIDTATSWKYYDGGDIADPTWIDLGYAETGWSTGTADFGFGDPGITTTVASGNYTYYYRKTFTGGMTAGSWNTARIRLKRDDGAVIYLNGVEIARTNMPTGTISYSTLASENVSGEEESKYFNLIVSGVSFNTGANVLAVEVHQDDIGSSDTHFDLMMSGEFGAITDVGYRFNNIAVPQGAKIIDAFLRLTSANTTETISQIHIEGEAVDNALPFANTANNISSRPRTTATAEWTNSKPLLDGREVRMDGLTSIVQEITDRSGWSSGNAMAFILSGHEAEFYSFDGGYAPELTISYLDTTQTTIQYLITVDPNDMPDVYNFMTDGSPTVTIGTSLRAVTNINIGYIGTTSMCVASSDDEFDALHIINRFSGKNKRIGSFGGSTEIEAIAMSKNADSLFAVDEDQFGLIDLVTGAFTPYGPVIGTANGSEGSQNLNDVDGLAYDLTRNVLWATERRTAPTHDLIFLINVSTGQFVPNAFGPGVDYIVATGGGLLADLDDIAVNPNTGNLFAMNNDDGGTTNLVEIDVSTGTPNVINPTGLDDMEGQGFHNDGLFYSTSGREGTPDNAFYRVDTSNSSLTLVGFFETEGDFEGCDCKTGPSVNFIDGHVFEDVDLDSILTKGIDVLQAGVNVYLYRDLDTNGVLTLRAPDPLISSTTTGADGYFAFGVSDPGIYIVVIDSSDLPLGHQFTTKKVYDVRFAVNGQVDLNKNFGYRNGSALPVELAFFDGENKGQENNLYWTTTAEINNDYFNVQRSLDAIHFETIGVVNGAGNSDKKIHYEFVDEQPYKGINYYRLQQVDFDGTNEFSKIIDLEVASNNTEASISLDVFPNPSHDFVKIRGLEKLNVIEEVTLFVYDINGVEKFTKIFTIDTDIIELDISEFNNGIYFAELSSASKGLIQSMNFIKQDK
ncbi:MAG: T9SS type A sorting domain-containing protein [Chitinophagales bacterium]